jgi:CRP-like cAMP-binding protein
MPSSRKGMDRLNLRLHINEGASLPDDEPFKDEIDLLTNSDPKARTKENLISIYKYLNSFIHLRILCHNLNMTTKHGLTVLAETAKLTSFAFARTSIWEAGDLASHFYIVFDGAVSIQVPFQQHIALATEKILFPGQTFGEIGILNAVRTRSAGVHTVLNNTMVLHIPRETFITNLGPYFHRKYQERLSILRIHPAFKNWPLSKLKFICQVLCERTVQFGGEVASEGKNIKNKYFINILRRGQIRIDIKLSDQNNKQLKDLSLCVLSPGSIVFEPKLVNGTLEKNIEASKIDRGENSTVRWSYTAVAKTSVLLWCISRHTFYNLDGNDRNSLVLLKDLQSCVLKIPKMNVLLATYYQQENWKKYKVRHLIDVYSSMSDNHRKKLTAISQRNQALQNKEYQNDVKVLENYMMDTPIFEHESKFLKQKLSPLKKGRAFSKDGIEENIKISLFDRRRRLLSKGGIIDEEEKESNNHNVDIHQNKRAISARRKRNNYNLALKYGTTLTGAQCIKLSHEGRTNVLCRAKVSVDQSQHSITFIPAVDDLLSTQPFVEGIGESINSNVSGLLSTANLKTRIESNKYTYRVPSVMKNYKEDERKGTCMIKRAPVVPKRQGKKTKNSPLMRRKNNKIFRVVQSTNGRGRGMVKDTCEVR